MQNQKLDIVALIEKNPLVRLSKNYENKFITKIQGTFTESQQQLFISSFYTYLNYNSKTDFVIELESVWKWLGFGRKNDCKKVLEKNFIKDIDFKINFIELLINNATEVAVASKVRGCAGKNKEIILMNVNTFKKLCLKSNTKKADEIHDYFIKLEETLQEIVNEESNELKLQLNHKEKEYKKTHEELARTKTQMNRILNRKYQDVKEGVETVYVYVDNKNDTTSRIKIGKSKNLSKREQTYSNTNSSGEIVYYQQCHNCTLIENLSHHILDKYRIHQDQELFNCSVELAIQTIKSIIYFTDYSINTIETFIPQIHNTLSTIFEKENIINEFSENQIKKIKEPIKKTLTESVVNPKDFDKFINDCCNIADDIFVPKSDIKQAHRFWSKNSTKEVITALDNYLKKFKSSVIILDDMKRNVFKGISLKSLYVTLDNDEFADINNFVNEKCSIDYNYRISYCDFFDHFIKNKQIINLNFKLSYSIKQKTQKYLESIFAGGRVHISSKNKSTHLYGIWGLGMDFNNFGLKEKVYTNKKVEQYQDNLLINTWNSLSLASRDLNLPISSLSNYCRFQTIVGNYYYKYENL